MQDTIVRYKQSFGISAFDRCDLADMTDLNEANMAGSWNTWWNKRTMTQAELDDRPEGYIRGKFNSERRAIQQSGRG